MAVVMLACLLFAKAGAQATAAADLSALITAQDAQLGARPGNIVIANAGRIGTPLLLHRGHSLELKAPVVWAATVTLEGGNVLQCDTGAEITADLPTYTFPQGAGMMLLADAVSGVQVQGCRVTSKAQSVVLAGYPVSDVTMTGNVLEGLTLVATSGMSKYGKASITSANLAFTNNTVSMPTAGSNNAAVLLFFAEGVSARGNVFNKVVHGFQWWGGNSGDAGANLSQVTRAGHMTFTGNSCKNVSGSCIWGSMGSDVVMKGNTADGCGDVCFDTEGGLRTQIVENTASGCVNGCAAVFFFTDQTEISGNHFRGASPGGGLIFVKNKSQNPSSHNHLMIRNNDLRCEPGICTAMYMEAAGGVSFVNNQVTDGVFRPVAYGREVLISGNHLVYTKALPAGSAAITAPAVLGGTALEVVGNTIESKVPQLPGTACIAASWSDFNASDFHAIAANTCGGAGGFPVGLSVVNAGKNAGMAGVWYLSANRLGAGKVNLISQTPYGRFFDLGECGTSGCQVNAPAIATAGTVPGCAGAAPKAASGAMAVCLGPVRGWGSVPLPR